MPTSAMAFCVTAIVAFFAPNGTTTEPAQRLLGKGLPVLLPQPHKLI